MTSSLEAQFHQAMIDAYESAKRECKYHASYFIQMVHTHGGVETARRLLQSQENAQSGFTTLWECGRLDLSVEAHVLQERFKELFSDQERQIARQRLEDYGYFSSDR